MRDSHFPTAATKTALRLHFKWRDDPPHGYILKWLDARLADIGSVGDIVALENCFCLVARDGHCQATRHASANQIAGRAATQIVNCESPDSVAPHARPIQALHKSCATPAANSSC